MKKFVLTVLCGALVMLTAPSCSKEDGSEVQSPVEQTSGSEPTADNSSELSATVWHVTANAKAANNGISKALTGDFDAGFSGQFAKDEEVYAFKNGTQVGILTAESAGATTSLSGDWMPQSVAQGDKLELRYLSPNFDYSGQDGTLASACAHYYATATVEVTKVEGDKVTLQDAEFSFCSSMVKFSLLDKDVTTFFISDGTNTISVTPSSATSQLVVSLPPSSGKQDYTLTASDGTNNFTVTKSYNIEKNKYYSANVTFFKTLGGVFSVSPTKKVTFASGNLQYLPSEDCWRFAENQTDAILGGNNGNSASKTTWMDLLAWGSWIEGATKKPYDYNDEVVKDIEGKSAVVGSGFFTLSVGEWAYLLNTNLNGNYTGYAGETDYHNETREGLRDLVEIDGNWFMVVLPDKTNTTSPFSWTSMADLEKNHALILPLTGDFGEGGWRVFDPNRGRYWSSTYFYRTNNGQDRACFLDFLKGELNMFPDALHWGFAVRLAKEVN